MSVWTLFFRKREILLVSLQDVWSSFPHMKRFHFLWLDCRRRPPVMWMSLPGDPTWPGQEDLSHRVPPINCSDTRVDDTQLASPQRWPIMMEMVTHIIMWKLLKSSCSLGSGAQLFLRCTNGQSERKKAVIKILFNSPPPLVDQFAEKHCSMSREDARIRWTRAERKEDSETRECGWMRDQTRGGGSDSVRLLLELTK